jgi:DNA modification methylase
MIINGDCVEEIKKIGDNTIDLIITDPPYFISRESNFKKISEIYAVMNNVEYCPRGERKIIHVLFYLLKMEQQLEDLTYSLRI